MAKARRAIPEDHLSGLLPWFPAAEKVAKLYSSTAFDVVGNFSDYILVGQMLDLAKKRGLKVVSSPQMLTNIHGRRAESTPHPQSRYGYRITHTIDLPSNVASGRVPWGDRYTAKFTIDLTAKISNTHKAKYLVINSYLDLYVYDREYHENAYNICYRGSSLISTLRMGGPEQCLSRAIAICQHSF